MVSSLASTHPEQKKAAWRTLTLLLLTSIMGVIFGVLALIPSNTLGDLNMSTEFMAHAGAFAVFSAMLYTTSYSLSSFTQRMTENVAVVSTFLICMSGAAPTSEILQQQMGRGRSFEISDLVADGVGITMGIVIAVVISRNQI